MKILLLAVAGLAVTIACISWKKPGQNKMQNANVQVIDKPAEKRVDVLIDGKPFTSYIYPDVLKKPVLYPIRTSKGTFITRGWPMDPRPGERVDHPHHVGMWFNYGDVNGYDFWNNSNDVGNNPGPFGTIRHQAVLSTKSGKQGELKVSAQWQKPNGEVMLNEQTTFVFSGTDSDRTIERITTLTAVNGDVSFKDNKEGVFGMRLTRELEHPSDKAEVFTDASGKKTDVPKTNNEGVTGKYHSSEGKTGDDVWGTRGKWVNLTGTIGSEPVSVVMMDNPANVGFPTYWHARGYGLFAANPLGQSALSNGKETLNYVLPAGKSVTFRYKVLIHSGSQLNDSEVTKQYEAFAKK